MEPPSTSQVREWARSQGIPVGDRGRLPADLVARYLAAHRSRRAPAAPTPRPGTAEGGVVIGRTVTAQQRWDWNR